MSNLDYVTNYYLSCNLSSVTEYNLQIICPAVCVKIDFYMKDCIFRKGVFFINVTLGHVYTWFYSYIYKKSFLVK